MPILSEPSYFGNRMITSSIPILSHEKAIFDFFKTSLKLLKTIETSLF